MSQTCDVIVLGMGTCGEDAALRLARAGLDVVGIEDRLLGGECPYWACLPTKSLVRSAGLVAEARRADGLVGRVSVEPDWAVVAARLRAEVTGGWDDSGGVARFTSKGGRFFRGRGRVTGPRTVVVAGRGGRRLARDHRGHRVQPRGPADPGTRGRPVLDQPRRCGGREAAVLAHDPGRRSRRLRAGAGLRPVRRRRHRGRGSRSAARR